MFAKRAEVMLHVVWETTLNNRLQNKDYIFYILYLEVNLCVCVQSGFWEAIRGFNHHSIVSHLLLILPSTSPFSPTFFNKGHLSPFDVVENCVIPYAFVSVGWDIQYTRTLRVPQYTGTGVDDIHHTEKRKCWYHDNNARTHIVDLLFIS